MELFESKWGDILRMGMAKAEATIDRSRVEAALRVLRYFEDKDGYQADDLYQSYKSLFADADKFKARPKTCYNLVAFVVNKFCNLYQDPIKRTWPGDSPMDRRAADTWEEIAGGFDDEMQAVDELTLLTGTVDVMPTWLTDDKLLDWGIYTSNQIDHTPDSRNPKIAREVMYSWEAVEKGASQIIRNFWSATEFIETVGDTVTTPAGDRTNPYQMIPRVTFRNKRPRNSYYGTVASDLVTANLVLNMMMTSLNFGSIMQAFATLVTRGRDRDQDLELGAAGLIDLPDDENASADFISPPTNIDQFINAINKNLEMFFATRDIPETAVVGSRQGASGVAIVADQEALRRYRKKRIKTMRPLESRLIRVALMVHTLQTKKQFIPYDQWPAPNINYTEMKAPMDADARQMLEYKIKHNAATPLDIIRAEDPDATDDEILEKYEANKEFNLRERINREPVIGAGGLLEDTDLDFNDDEDEEE